MMKRTVFVLLFCQLFWSNCFSQADAGPDKTVSKSHPTTTIGKNTNNEWCYHWEATPADLSMIDMSAPSISVSPTQTTTYKLTVTGPDFSFVSRDEVTVYKFGINYVRHTSGKEWKIVIGEPFEFDAEASTDCSEWVWDMEDGLPDAWNPEGGNMKTGTMKIPYSDLARADNGWFGEAYGTVKVTCKDAEGNLHEFSSTETAPVKKVKVFFDPTLTIDGEIPSADDTPPCWFVFWQQGAVPGLEDFDYMHDESWGVSEVQPGLIWDTYILRVGILAGKVHYPNGLFLNNVEYGGAVGIDCCMEVVLHEKQHNVWATERLAGAPDLDPKTAIDSFLGDGLPDNREPQFRTNILLKDTYNVAGQKGPQYTGYGDDEYSVIVYSFGAKGVAAKDWSKEGKQW